jgi:hypothetical protein
MATYLPPSENLPIFDTSVFDETNGAYLTYTSAKKLFLTYPIAQGEETIASLIAGSIDYTSPASGSYFEIGTNQVSGGTIRLGPTGVSGVSVHAGNIDCTNNTINNATDAAANNLSLGNSQTTGVLNIGTGVRATTGNGGAINIGGGAGSSAPINIGPISAVSGTGTVNINTSTSGAHPVNIGSTSAITTLNGNVITAVGRIAGGLSSIGTSLPYAIPTTSNIDVTVVINTASASGTLTLPTTNTAGQKITIRNITAYSHDISSPSGNIWAVNTATFPTTLAIPAYSSCVLFGDGGTWYQIGVTSLFATLTATTSVLTPTLTTASGTALNVGTTTATSLNLGASGITTTVNGNLSVSNPITLPITAVTPTSTQLGYYNNSFSSTAVTINATGLNVVTISNLPIGIYMFNFFITSYDASIGATQIMTYTVGTAGSATTNIKPYIFSGVATTFQGTQTLSGAVICTTAVNTVTFNCVVTTGGGQITGSLYGYNYFKIG